MPENLDDPEVFELLQTYQVYAHSIELAGNTTRMNAIPHMVNILLRRQLFQNHLILNLRIMKSKGFLKNGEILIKASQKLYR